MLLLQHLKQSQEISYLYDSGGGRLLTFHIILVHHQYLFGIWNWSKKLCSRTQVYRCPQSPLPQRSSLRAKHTSLRVERTSNTLVLVDNPETALTSPNCFRGPHVQMLLYSVFQFSWQLQQPESEPARHDLESRRLGPGLGSLGRCASQCRQ